MFIYSDINGSNHLIDGSDSLCKALGLPRSTRAIIMADESGNIIAAGRTASDLQKSEQLIKSLKHDGVVGEKSPIDSDDELIHRIGEIAQKRKQVEHFAANMPAAERQKHLDRVEKNPRVMLRKPVKAKPKATITSVRAGGTMRKSLFRNESRVESMASLLDELLALKAERGLA
jgi:hypothetical protein